MVAGWEHRHGQSCYDNTLVKIFRRAWELKFGLFFKYELNFSQIPGLQRQNKTTKYVFFSNLKLARGMRVT